MEKIKAFLVYLETSKFKLHRLANANLDMCYSNYEMKNLLLMLKEKQEMAQKAGILSTDFHDGNFKCFSEKKECYHFLNNLIMTN
ncbi:hypothetical protein ABFY48_09660 [Lysinibacillus pakistanensis]|uniref:hypothetical protein n=1 Tax=Lysinibacillus pakistanensis TaxID=759811 RepID=UPI003D2E2BD4